MTHVLSVWPIIARCYAFCVPFNGFQSYKKDGRVVLNSCVQRNRNYNAGGTGKDQGFPCSLVAVGGPVGVRGPMYCEQSI